MVQNYHLRSSPRDARTFSGKSNRSKLSPPSLLASGLSASSLTNEQGHEVDKRDPEFKSTGVQIPCLYQQATLSTLSSKPYAQRFSIPKSKVERSPCGPTSHRPRSFRKYLMNANHILGTSVHAGNTTKNELDTAPPS